MTIKFANFEICSERESPEAFTATTKRIVSKDSLIGYSKILTRDGGNDARTVSFSVEKSYARAPEAARAVFETAQAVSALSPATLCVSFSPDDPSDKIEIANAALAKCRAASDGNIAKFYFEFSDGANS